jgi:hypothetical protein
MPKIYQESGANPGFKFAFVYTFSPSYKSRFNFFRDLMSLASIEFEVFPDKDKAMAWLKSESVH